MRRALIVLTAAAVLAGCGVGYVDRPMPDGTKLVRTCFESKIIVAQDGSYWLLDDRAGSKNVLTPIAPGAKLDDICK